MRNSSPQSLGNTRGRGALPTQHGMTLFMKKHETPKHLPDILLAYLVICLCNLTISLHAHALVNCALYGPLGIVLV